MASFCPGCGTPLDGAIAAPPPAAEAMEVTLARIDADARVKIAELAAGAERAAMRSQEAIAETNAEASVEQAAAVAEVITAAAPDDDQGAPDDAPGLPEPVIITQVNDDADEQDVTMPEVEPAEPAEPKRRGLGLW